MDFIAVGALIMSRKQASSVVPVVWKEKGAQLETAPQRRVSNYALIASHFPVTRFCKVFDVCGSDTHFEKRSTYFVEKQ